MACQQQNISQLIGALAFLSKVKKLAKVVVGVTSCKELKEILTAIDLVKQVEMNWSDFMLNDEEIIIPSKWKIN